MDERELELILEQLLDRIARLETANRIMLERFSLASDEYMQAQVTAKGAMDVLGKLLF